MTAPLLLVDVQRTLTTLSKLVQTWSSWVCGPTVTFLQARPRCETGFKTQLYPAYSNATCMVAAGLHAYRLPVLQFQGAVILLLLALGWTLAGLARNAELKRRKRLLLYNHGPSQEEEWPGVTLILPLKGCRKHSIRNWESQLAQDYEGSLEILFVVDSREDPAFHYASLVAEKAKHRNARVLVATPAKTNSQKIHNIQTGIQAACREHEFALCVDDDVSLHPSTLRETVTALRNTPGMFMATGYPFDIPLAGSNLLTYSILSYHLPLLIAFSLQQKTQFVWGGFMMFRLSDMLADKYGIMQAWSGGGYSDDLITAAKCGEHGLNILCPAFAIFPQWLDGDYDWARYWNYLRRQVFVMDTYRSPLNKRINHAMMAIHSYLSLAFVVPCLSVAFRLVLWILATILLPTQKVYVGPGTSMHWVRNFGASACPWASMSLAAYLIGLGLAASSLCWMSGVLLKLFQCLSPRSEPIDPGCFHWGKLWLGFFLNNCMIPFCMLYTRLTSSVVWSGVEYTRRNGVIVGIRRLAGTVSHWKIPRKLIDAQIA